ncbi:MAG: glycosyltransferase family 2 protein [Flavobacteriaceae bacterium]|jgi:glycosyltransferase involved in cell wall biosynthesis|nr:glycosyltransferase family 2 protein [Flavobacteriaceae bacterium]
MKFLIVIPAHNEEQNILSCLQSLENQTFKDFKTVVVNDGSTDKTLQIAEQFNVQHFDFAQCNKRFKVQSLEKSEHEPGAKVVRTFGKGLESENLETFDVICKFDADIIFPENYLEEIHKIYQQNPKAGMVSGLVYIEKNGGWIYENLSSKNHVRGPVKSYRKECFLAMNGLRAVLGWDNIDEFLAKMHGYEIITLKNLWVKHLRPTAYKYKNQKAEKLGEYFYNIGLNFPLTLISSAKSAFKNKSVSEFFITMKSFLKQKHPRILTVDEIKFIRKLRWKDMWKKLM